jgi:hypothetical protein
MGTSPPPPRGLFREYCLRAEVHEPTSRLLAHEERLRHPVGPSRTRGNRFLSFATPCPSSRASAFLKIPVESGSWKEPFHLSSGARPHTLTPSTLSPIPPGRLGDAADISPAVSCVSACVCVRVSWRRKR